MRGAKVGNAIVLGFITVMMDAQIDWSDGAYAVNGARLHYARGGHGSPVLLLHGVTDNGRCWGRTAVALAKRHDVVVLDQRGHGRSSAPASGYDLDDLAGDAAELITALRIAPAAIVGHSLGARVALTLAAARPALVAGLVLEDPPLASDATAWTARNRDSERYQWFEWLREYKALTREQLIARCHDQSPLWDEAERIAWAESKLQASSRLWEPGGISFSSDWRAELRAVAAPLLLVRGDVERGALIDDACAAEVLALARAGHDVHIAEAGHSIHRDQAAAFAAVVAPFLAPQMNPTPADR